MKLRRHIRDQIDIERKEAMVFVKRKTRRRHIVAALRVADKMIRALGDPGYRSLQLLGSNRGEGVFAVRKQFGAEASADLRGDHAQLFRRHIENLEEDVADRVRALTR